MREHFAQRRLYYLRWLVALGAAGLVFAGVFVASKVLLRPLPEFVAKQQTPTLVRDFAEWIDSLGPVGIAIACAATVLRLATPWVRRGLPASDQVESRRPARGDGLRGAQPLWRWLSKWTVVATVFVLVPIVAVYEQLPPAGGLTFDAILCFLFGAAVLAALAAYAVPTIERLSAATIGTVWRWGAADLRDQWRSTYQYRSEGESKTGVQLMQISQIGRLAHARNIGGTSPHRHVIRMRISGDYVTGEWRNVTRGTRHHGVFQLRIKANGREMVGRWVGFDSDANIQDGYWIWERL